MTLTRHPLSRSQRGFSLIELAVVVAIIGILAAIAIPTFLGQRESAQDAAAKSALRNVAAEARALAAQRDAAGFPDDLLALVRGLRGVASFPEGLLGQLETVEPTYTYVEGDTASKGPNDISVGFPLEVAGNGDPDFDKVAFAALSESGTCWFLTDDLDRGIRYAKDSSEGAADLCYAGRIKLADDFSIEDWPNDNAPVWFDDINDPAWPDPSAPDIGAAPEEDPDGGGEEPGGSGSSGPDWVSISAGGLHTCGVTTAGDGYCWGDAGYGQMGNGATEGEFATPQAISGYTWASISAGDFFHTCGVTTAGDGYCWGDADYGMLGNGATSGIYATPQAISGYTWASISAGESHTCGITTSGAGYCWGYATYGRLGNNQTSGEFATPQAISGGHTWASISAGLQHTCGVTTAGDGYCWGNAFSGMLGNGSTDDYSTPQLVLGGHSWASISAGAFHTCGITTSGAGYCWGDAYFGVLGNNADEGEFVTPHAISGGHTWTSISAGSFHTCGVTTAGDGYCWGWAEYGQLGNGSTDDYSTPQLVLGGHSWTSISAGDAHTCGVTDSGAGYCWGDGFFGQLGNGSTDGYSTPQPVVEP